jgi:hypothetical protein
LAHEDNHPFAHLSSDLAQEEEVLDIDEEEIADEDLVTPVVDDLEPPPPLPLLSSMPTQIVRAHKVLDRARSKRAERIEEGRTLIIDHDKPPPAPPRLGGGWSWITTVVLVLAFGSVLSMFLYQMTRADVMEEAIAIDGVIEEALPEEPPPAPPVKQALVVEEQKIEPPTPEEKPALKFEEKPAPKSIEVAKAPEKKLNKVKPILREPKVREPKVIAAPEKIEEPTPAPVEEPPAEIVAAEEEPVPETNMPAVGFIEVVTTAGAKVEIDSREVGTAPMQKIELRPGRHAIWVTLSGHEVFQKDVFVKRGEVIVLDAKLVPIAPTAP